MNSTFESRTPATGIHGPIRGGAGAVVTRFAALGAALALCGGLIGCGFLKPARPTARHYVLTPIAETGSVSAPTNSLPIGLGRVKLPAYLFDTSLAVRKGTNEIEYLSSALWAERLDAGFQRVLAANLALVLPAQQVRLSAWRSDDVAAEVYVTVEQFDVDASGQGVLIAQWRILAPGGEKVLKAGGCRLVRKGPPPDVGASGAVATLSELVADLSRELVPALKASTPAAPRGPSQP
jgi:uncharacterized lipoprotein YmbA